MLYKKRNSRLMLLTGLVLTLVIVVNASIFTYVLRRLTVSDWSERVASLSLILAEHSAQTVFSANAALQSIVDVVAPENLQNEKDYREFATKWDLYLLLWEKTRSNPIVDVAAFIDRDGNLLNYTRSFPAPNINVSDRDYFRWLSDHDDSETFYSVPVQSKGNGKPVFYLARRLSDRDNNFLGLVLIGVSVKVFTDLYEQIGANLGNGSALALYRGDKVPIAHWPSGNLTGNQKHIQNTIRQSLENSQVNGGVLIAEAPSVTQSNTQIRRIVSYRPVQNFPLIVGAAVSEERYLSGWMIGTAGVVVASIFNLLVLFFGMRLLRSAYQKNAEIEYNATHDALTNLPNRALVSDRLEHGIAQAKRSKIKFALLSLDIDNFKALNKTYGHAVGDLVLQETSRRIIRCLRESDTVGRVEDDEFMMLLLDIDNAENAMFVAQKIRHALNVKFMLGDRALVINASIGISMFPDDGKSEKELAARSYAALRFAKERGKNNVQLFTENMLPAAVG